MAVKVYLVFLRHALPHPYETLHSAWLTWRDANDIVSVTPGSRIQKITATKKDHAAVAQAVPAVSPTPE